MRFRNWLLTGTSITLLALAPASAVRAQDATNPDLVAAYQAYVADQSDDNKTKLNEACIAAGFQSFDDCVAATFFSTNLGGFGRRLAQSGKHRRADSKCTARGWIFGIRISRKPTHGLNQRAHCLSDRRRHTADC